MSVPDALIDTDIFVYAWTSLEKEKHDIALQLFEKVWSREITFRKIPWIEVINPFK
ncbi:hypothetical protein ACKUB1_07275 [Methanospirillum stamsii]|uniref:hypothetical protein n=1 Tax=Methanospirillum stamsii TaxID=1277351 RepID=UPI0015E875C6|nr:hypothetical protein [Methanospirillum stamsii]